MIIDSCWLILVLTCFWVAWASFRRLHLLASDRATVSATVQRLLKPRTPDDCPACRRHGALPLAPPAPPPAVQPWRERKSPRGAPKRIATAGFACLNHGCPYYRITDAEIHALVGDGTHGKHERIQTFRCQACGTTFSARRDTPLYGYP